MLLGVKRSAYFDDSFSATLAGVLPPPSFLAEGESDSYVLSYTDEYQGNLHEYKGYERTEILLGSTTLVSGNDLEVSAGPFSQVNGVWTAYP